MAQVNYSTPGVYIVEESAFPRSVAAIPTAVPAFVGYTQKADRSGTSLALKPTRVTSLSEYVAMFGMGPTPLFTLAAAAAPAAADFSAHGTGYTLALKDETKYAMYNAMRLFYANGGGTCYIVSVGTFGVDAFGDMKAKLETGIDALKKSSEPTMLVVPDAVSLSAENCAAIQQKMLSHCGGEMQSRVAILDVFNGNIARNYDDATDVVTVFRNSVMNFLDYGAAYYPWLETSIVQESELSFRNIENNDVLKTILEADAGSDAADKKTIALKAEITKTATAPDADAAKAEKETKRLNQLLMTACPSFKSLVGTMRKKLNLMAPSSAMAGIYTMVDNNRGVWKAPANVGMSAVIAPSVDISQEDQQDLNVTLSGKSVNAIRSFVGEGTLVWGARTLDGNSMDWRYINVRRTMIFIEQSVKAAAKAYVFEPNVAKTWISVKGMISNFLTDVWKAGGLAGAIPDDAFSVEVGLGSTMTAVDILNGYMRISVKVAVSRPAEFIVITFEQQMQKS